ncbi:MAG: Ig-like domain-containing protein [Pseudomonadales bacterium]
MLLRYTQLTFMFVVAAAALFGCGSESSMSPSADTTLPPADTTPPTVLTINPTGGASDIPTSSPVVVVFSEAMDPASLAETAYSLARSSGPVVGSSASLEGSTLTITPDLELEIATDYVVTVGRNLTDLAGNALPEQVQVEFTTIIPATPAGANVRYVGRFDDTDPGAVRFSWSGGGFVLRFRGTGARATMRGGRYFTVVVDGEVQPRLAVSLSDATYELASNLANGEHTIEVYRRTSVAFEPSVVSAVEVDGQPLPVPAPTRYVEVVGDSWSTGHGVDGPNANCSFSAETENHYVTWGAIAARAVGAELSTVAAGGKGIVRDSTGNRNEQMPTLYERVIASEAGSTGIIRPVDAVIVSLGANDFIGGALPTEFVVEYASFLEQIRARHPDALIACVWPQLDNPLETQRARTAIDAAIALRTTVGDSRVIGADLELEQLVDFGCDFHPGARTHELMAEKTVEFLMDELGW